LSQVLQLPMQQVSVSWLSDGMLSCLSDYGMISKLASYISEYVYSWFVCSRQLVSVCSSRHRGRHPWVFRGSPGIHVIHVFHTGFV